MSDLKIYYDMIDNAYIIKIQNLGIKVRKFDLLKMLEYAERNQAYDTSHLSETMLDDINEIKEYQNKIR